MGTLMGQSITNKLTAIECRNKQHSGRTQYAERHADGNGLYLAITHTGTRHWVQRLWIRGKRKTFGLGTYPLVSLAEARKLAREHRRIARAGGDPLEQRRRRDEIPDFKTAAEAVIKQRSESWKPGGKSRKHWLTSLAAYAYPVLGEKAVSEITSADVLAVVEPIWNKKRETATRVRQRISTIMARCIVAGYREDNPADHILAGLTSDKGRAVQHHKALPYEAIPGALRRIKETGAWIGTKLALEFLILTACRSGEVRGATWDEFDLPAALWEIPADRMKAKKPHRVPLSGRSMEILGEAKAIPSMLAHLAGNPLVFPSVRGRPLSDNTLSKLCRENDIGAVPHGFRSSFRDWAAETTNSPYAVMEAALAHRIASATVRAYAWSDLFDKRRVLMERYARFACQERGEVVSIAAGTQA